MDKVVTRAFRNSLRHWTGAGSFRELDVHCYMFTPVIRTLRQLKLKDNMISANCSKPSFYLFYAYI